MTENKGRNIKPMIIDAWDYIQDLVIVFLHTKRTKVQAKLWLKWLESICSSIATRHQIVSARYLFENNTTLGMILPKPFEGTSDHSLSWAGTGKLAYQIYSSYLESCRQKRIKELEFFSRILVFPVGGMMMFRVSALNEMQKWLELNRSYRYFRTSSNSNKSPCSRKIILLFCEELGYSWAVFDNKNQKGKYLLHQNII